MQRKAAAFGFVCGLMVVGAWMAGSGSAAAGLPIQKKAKELGFSGQGCVYCHNEKLPKKDAVTMNDRGKWLQTEKDKRKAKEVDAAWLKDYVEPKK